MSINSYPKIYATGHRVTAGIPKFYKKHLLDMQFGDAK